MKKKKTTRVTPELPREKEGFDKLPRDQVKVLQSRKRQKSRFFNNCRFLQYENILWEKQAKHFTTYCQL